jgi:hypothetical protein
MDNEKRKGVVVAAILAGMALAFAVLFYADDRLGPGTYGPSVWSDLRLAAYALIAVVPVLGILALWRLGERLSAPVQVGVPRDPRPVSGGVHWLEVLPEFRKSMRKLAIATLLKIAGVTIVMLYVFASTLESFPRPAQLFFVAVLAFAVLVPAIMLVRPPGAWRTRLGTDGRQLLLDLGDGEVRRYPFEAVFGSGNRQLLAGRWLIPLRVGHRAEKPLFDEKELAGYVLARIPPSNRLVPLGLFLRALGAGNREARWGIALLVIVGALFVLSELFPEVLAGMKKAALDLLGEK